MRWPPFLFLILMIGCMPAKRPCIEVPCHYTEADNCETPYLACWWEEFRDETLNALVERSICCNYDLNIAREKICEARGVLGIETAPLLPQIDGTLGYRRMRNSETLVNSEFTGGTFTNLYQTGFDALWEIDLFGKQIDKRRGACLALLASRETMLAVQLTISVEVTKFYLQLRSLQQQIQIAKNHIASEKKLVELTKERFDAGLTPELDLYLAKALLEERYAILPNLEAKLKATIYTLAVLTGDLPENLAYCFEKSKPIPTACADLAAGIPSELLCLRPDIREKELLMLSSGAYLSAAKKEFFPTLSLSGFYNWATGFSKSWFKPASRDFDFVPALVLPIFHGGAIWSNVVVEGAKQRQAVLAYEQTVLNALKEVESSLITYIKEEQRKEALAREVASYREARELAHTLYLGGFVDFLYVIDVERDLYVSENLLVESEEQTMIDLISFYKALGGGVTCCSSP